MEMRQWERRIKRNVKRGSDRRSGRRLLQENHAIVNLSPRKKKVVLGFARLPQLLPLEQLQCLMTV